MKMPFPTTLWYNRRMNATAIIARIRRIYDALTADFQAHPAPVVDLIAAQGASPFHILVATMLSARTKDATTAKVIREQLFPVVHGPDDLQRLSVGEIERLIFPVGFFHAKAQYLKALPEALDAKFGGVLPETVEELCELPGVGRKTANLVVAQAFRKPGICVDVHVHRICNRLGLVKTATPLETEMRLRELLPVELWRGWNGAFVSFGQRICTPRNPKCAECPISSDCATHQHTRRGA